MGKVSKTEAEKEIESFFKKISTKKPGEVKKIKRLAMRNSIKLGRYRKKFCKFCLNPYKNPKIRINNGIKLVACDNCGKEVRWKL